MKIFFNIVASILSLLVVVAGILLAIPSTRNQIFDKIAPLSPVYQEKLEENGELNNAYLSNMELLSETRTSLINAEFKAISYQNELGVLQASLAASLNNLAVALNQKTQLERSLELTNQNLINMNSELSNMREEFRQLNIDLDVLLDNSIGNEVRITELQNEIYYLSNEIANLEAVVTSLEMAIETFGQQIYKYEGQISSQNILIAEYETQIVSLTSQINELQEIIRQLEEINSTLKGDETYKQIFQQLIGGTLTEVKADDLYGLTEIRSYAFYNCPNLQRVELPYTVESIGDFAFYGCSSLREVVVTKQLKHIGYEAFAQCSMLTTFDFTHIEYIEDFAFNQAGLIEARLPASASNWGSCVLHNTNIQNVYFEEGVTLIPFGLLHGCRSLVNVYLPSTLIDIATYGISVHSSNVTVYYAGTEEQFRQIAYNPDDNSALATAYMIYNYPVPLF